MVTSFINWIKELVAGAMTSVATFFAGFAYGTMREKKKQLEREVRDARKDAEIASQPAKSGDDLIDSL